MTHIFHARHLPKGKQKKPWSGKIAWTPTEEFRQYVQKYYHLKGNENLTLLQGREADNTVVHYEQIRRMGPVVVPAETRSQATRSVIDLMIDIPRVIPPLGE